MMQVGASIAISALATLSLTVFRNRLHADPGALHQALAAGYTSGLKVAAVIIAANFLVAAFVLPRRMRGASAASGGAPDLRQGAGRKETGAIQPAAQIAAAAHEREIRG